MQDHWHAADEHFEAVLDTNPFGLSSNICKCRDYMSDNIINEKLLFLVHLGGPPRTTETSARHQLLPDSGQTLLHREADDQSRTRQIRKYQLMPITNANAFKKLSSCI